MKEGRKRSDYVAVRTMGWGIVVHRSRCGVWYCGSQVTVWYIWVCGSQVTVWDMGLWFTGHGVGYGFVVHRSQCGIWHYGSQVTVWNMV